MNCIPNRQFKDSTIVISKYIHGLKMYEEGVIFTYAHSFDHLILRWLNGVKIIL